MTLISPLYLLKLREIISKYYGLNSFKGITIGFNHDNTRFQNLLQAFQTVSLFKLPNVDVIFALDFLFCEVYGRSLSPTLHIKIKGIAIIGVRWTNIWVDVVA